MVFGIGGYFDKEMIARFLADEPHQFIGVTEFSGITHTRRHITT